MQYSILLFYPQNAKQPFDHSRYVIGTSKIAVFGNSCDPLRFYSCFMLVSKSSNFRGYILDTSNSCHKIFIHKNKIKMRRAKEK